MANEWNATVDRRSHEVGLWLGWLMGAVSCQTQDVSTRSAAPLPNLVAKVHGPLDLAIFTSSSTNLSFNVTATTTNNCFVAIHPHAQRILAPLPHAKHIRKHRRNPSISRRRLLIQTASPIEHSLSPTRWRHSHNERASKLSDGNLAAAIQRWTRGRVLESRRRLGGDVFLKWANGQQR